VVVVADAFKAFSCVIPSIFSISFIANYKLKKNFQEFL